MLTIHVGLHKTGTTSLQRDLAKMRRKEHRRVIYRGKDYADNDGFLSPLNDFQVPARAEHTPTVRALKKGRHVLLSHENFLGHPYDPEVGEMYSQATSNAAGIRDYFDDKTPFQLVIYLRPQHRWLESLYSEYAKERPRSCAFNSTEFADRIGHAPYFRWTRLISDLKEEVGPDRLIVRPYKARTNVTADFLTVINIPTPTCLLSPTTENQSPSLEQLALQQRLHALLKAEGRPPHLAHLALTLARGSTFQHRTANCSLLTEAIQERLIDLAANDWERLPQVVTGTHLAEPHKFESIARSLQQAQVKPYCGSLDDASVDEVSLPLLIKALESVHTHPRYLPRRLLGVAAKVQTMARTDPRGLPGAFAALLRQRLNRDASI